MMKINLNEEELKTIRKVLYRSEWSLHRLLIADINAKEADKEIHKISELSEKIERVLDQEKVKQ